MKASFRMIMDASKSIHVYYNNNIIVSRPYANIVEKKSKETQHGAHLLPTLPMISLWWWSFQLRLYTPKPVSFCWMRGNAFSPTFILFCRHVFFAHVSHSCFQYQCRKSARSWFWAKANNFFPIAVDPTKSKSRLSCGLIKTQPVERKLKLRTPLYLFCQ